MPGGYNPYAGLGMPTPGMMGPGGMPDMESSMAMMQNPAMQQMMQQMLANPAFVDQVRA